MPSKHELKALDNIRRAADFYRIHGRLPARSATDRYESNLGACLYYYRKAIRGNSKDRKYYPSMFKLGKELGLPDGWWSSTGCKNIIRGRRERRALCNLELLARFYHTHHRYPSRASDTKGEVKLFCWLSTIRAARLGKHYGSIFYESLIDRARALLLPDDWCATGCHRRVRNG